MPLLPAVVFAMLALATSAHGLSEASAETFFWTSPASQTSQLPVTSTNPFAPSAHARHQPVTSINIYPQVPIDKALDARPSYWVHETSLDSTLTKYDSYAHKDNIFHDDLITFSPEVKRRPFLDLSTSDGQASIYPWERLHEIQSESIATNDVQCSLKDASATEDEWNLFVQQRYPTNNHAQNDARSAATGYDADRHFGKQHNRIQSVLLSGDELRPPRSNGDVVRLNRIAVYGENLVGRDEASRDSITRRSPPDGASRTDTLDATVAALDTQQSRQGKSLFALADAGFMASLLCARNNSGVCGDKKTEFNPGVGLRRERSHLLGLQTTSTYGAMREPYADGKDPASKFVNRQRVQGDRDNIEIQYGAGISGHEHDDYFDCYSGANRQYYGQKPKPSCASFPDDYSDFQEKITEHSYELLPVTEKGNEDSELQLGVPERVSASWDSNSDIESDSNTRVPVTPDHGHPRPLRPLFLRHNLDEVSETTSLLGASGPTSRPPVGPFSQLRRMVDAITNARHSRSATSTTERLEDRKEERSLRGSGVGSQSGARAAARVATVRTAGRELLERVKASSALQARRLASHSLYDSADEDNVHLGKPGGSARRPSTTFTSWLSRWKLPLARSSSSLSDTDEEDASASGFVGRAKSVLQRLLPQSAAAGKSVSWGAIPGSPRSGHHKPARRIGGVGWRARAWLQPPLRACAERARRVLERAPVIGGVLSVRGHVISSARSQEESQWLDELQEDPAGSEGFDDSDSSESSAAAIMLAKRRRRHRSCSEATGTRVREDTGQEGSSRGSDRRVTWCAPAESDRHGEAAWGLLRHDLSRSPPLDRSISPFLDNPRPPSESKFSVPPLLNQLLSHPASHQPTSFHDFIRPSVSDDSIPSSLHAELPSPDAADRPVLPVVTSLYPALPRTDYSYVMKPTTSNTNAPIEQPVGMSLPIKHDVDGDETSGSNLRDLSLL